MRALLAAEGFARAAWAVNEAAKASGLAVRLKDFGLVPWEREAEGFGPRFRSMVLAVEPAPAPEGVVARQVETFAEFVAARRVAYDAFEMSEHDRQLFERKSAEDWQWHERLPDSKTFAAFVDGEAVGNASAIFGANAAFLVGGSVREDARGRGAARALVRARLGVRGRTRHPGADRHGRVDVGTDPRSSRIRHGRRGRRPRGTASPDARLAPRNRLRDRTYA